MDMDVDIVKTPKSIIPFTRERQICDGDRRHGKANGNVIGGSAVQSLPGWPGIRTSDTHRICRLLRDEFYAEELERVARHLWILTTPSSRNVWALHAQKVLGREIVVTENPKLHLVWSGRRIFVKPLPAFLMSWDVWKNCLTKKEEEEGGGGEDGLVSEFGGDDDVRRATLGFLRSYRWLIRHESDFRIAMNEELQLVPKNVEWGELSSFLDEVEHMVDDADVSGRYHYGELRLSRLNIYAPFLFGKFHYEYMSMQYGEYFALLWAPILVTFVIISTMLDTMQVALASGQNISAPAIISNVFYWFSIVALILIVSVLVGSGFLWGIMIAKEFHYSFRRLRNWRLKKNA